MKDRNAEWLKIVRSEAGETQASLAEKTGLGLQTIVKLENGQRKGTPETWKKIEYILGNKTIESKYSLILKQLKESQRKGEKNSYVLYENSNAGIKILDCFYEKTEGYDSNIFKIPIPDAIALFTRLETPKKINIEDSEKSIIDRINKLPLPKTDIEILLEKYKNSDYALLKYMRLL